MASRIYTTEGIVLSRSVFGEANLIVSLFTKEYGRITARAQGARAPHSKLRFSLEPLSLGGFSLIKGVVGWRIVGALPQGSLLSLRAPAKTLGKIAALLTRLVPPHEPAPSLYALVLDDLRFLARIEDEELLRGAECVAVLRVLAELGYVQHEGEVAPLVRKGALTRSLALEMRRVRPQAVALINASLSVSGL